MRILQPVVLLILLSFSALQPAFSESSATGDAIADHAVDLLEFENDKQRQRYRQLVDEIRCPKCQNQNLADSDAPIASDLRKELHRLITEGHSDVEILQFMRLRYGEFVLYDPPVNAVTSILWVLPVLLLVLGLFIFARITRGGNDDGVEGSDD